MTATMNDIDQDIHDISLDKHHHYEEIKRVRSNTPSRMQFINYKKEFKKAEALTKA